MSFQSDEGHCGIVHYGKVDDITVSVNNSEIQPAKKGKMKRTFIIGEAYQTEPDTFPNKIHVGFNFNNKVANFFYNLFSGDGDNYWVMETDYNRYSLGKLTKTGIFGRSRQVSRPPSEVHQSMCHYSSVDNLGMFSLKRIK